MSASLVGSEMCIRDRAHECSPRMPTPGSKRTNWRGGAEGVIMGQREGTVSYTHLTLPTICSV
eukprot:7543535-Alexandrium_andersonii.AAC.1